MRVCRLLGALTALLVRCVGPFGPLTRPRHGPSPPLRGPSWCPRGRRRMVKRARTGSDRLFLGPGTLTPLGLRRPLSVAAFTDLLFVASTLRHPPLTRSSYAYYPRRCGPRRGAGAGHGCPNAPGLLSPAPKARTRQPRWGVEANPSRSHPWTLGSIRSRRIDHSLLCAGGVAPPAGGPASPRTSEAGFR